jgi:hypothetical protein
MGWAGKRGRQKNWPDNRNCAKSAFRANSPFRDSWGPSPTSWGWQSALAEVPWKDSIRIRIRTCWPDPPASLCPDAAGRSARPARSSSRAGHPKKGNTKTFKFAAFLEQNSFTEMEKFGLLAYLHETSKFGRTTQDLSDGTKIDEHQCWSSDTKVLSMRQNTCVPTQKSCFV